VPQLLYLFAPAVAVVVAWLAPGFFRTLRELKQELYRRNAPAIRAFAAELEGVNSTEAVRGREVALVRLMKTFGVGALTVRLEGRRRLHLRLVGERLQILQTAYGN
jgi:hypothetical protein